MSEQSQVESLRAENRALSEQLAKLQTERTRLVEVMQVPPEANLVHALRNVLNELSLLRALQGMDEPKK